MGAIDWAVFLGFLAYVVWDGIRRARGARDLEGYFAGGRSIPWWAAGLSVMATQASAITVIGTTGQGHDSGMDFVQIYFGLPFAMILLCIFLVPLYRKAPILTAYEYLEGRFGPATRTLASLIFLVSRCLAFGVVIYAPAVVLSALLHVDASTTVICIGALTTLYTMVGGVHAVIWTDVKQMSVIIGGLLLCLGILLYQILQHVGIGELLTFTGSAGKLNTVELHPHSTEFLPRWQSDSDSPASFWEEKYNFWSGLLGGLFLMLAYFGTDQSQVQRILTNPSVRESRLALLLSAFAKIPMQVLVLFLGVLLWAYGTLDQGADGRPVAELVYDPELAAALDRCEQERQAVEDLRGRFPGALAQRRGLALRIGRAGPEDRQLLVLYQGAVREVETLRRRARLLAARQLERERLLAAGLPVVEAELPSQPPGDTNYIFPRFILDHLPPVLLGLMIAAIFAAAMSSSDSALNSLTSSAVVDLYRRWIRPSATEAQSLFASRAFTVVLGAAATVAALSFQGSGSVIELVNRVGSYFYGSLLGVFALALLVPRAGARAGFCGLLGGMATVLLVHLTIRIEFLWYNVIGCLGVLLVGGLVSLIERRSPVRAINR